MLFMVVEHFKDGRVKEIYQRSAERGRMLPQGLTYIDSWVSAGLDRCYQLMQSNSEYQLREWIKKWEDLVEFEIVPVMSSSEAHEKVLAGSN